MGLAGGSLSTGVHTLPPHLPTPKQALHSHLGGRLSQELGGITLRPRAISGPFPLWPSAEMHGPLGAGPCLGPRTSVWGVSSGTWLGLQVDGGPFAELEMVYDFLFFPVLICLCTAVA